ncbi:MAG: HEAT repeat domain-containing protein [Candidatus Poribacteria bacterium]
MQIGTPEALEAAKDAVPALMQVLQNDQNWDVRWNAEWALKKIGTPDALKTVEEYQSRQ